VVLAVAVVAAGAFSAWWFTRKGPAFVELRASELKQTIVSSGRVMPPAEIPLDSRITSTVREILRREGESVRAGEPLLTLDRREVDASIAQAEAAVAQARAAMWSVHATTLPEATEALAQVRETLAEARRDLARERKLFEADITTQSALERAERTVRTFESQESAALTRVKAATSGGSAGVSAAAAVALAEAQLASIRLGADHATIVAPADGVVTRCLVEVGEVVRPGSALLVVTTVGPTRIVLEPDERNMALIAIGQKATVSTEAFPTEAFDAIVGYVAPSVDPERGTIEVRLDVPNPPAYLRPNMSVSVEIFVATRTDALALPATAIQELTSPHPWIDVLDANGKTERREISVGLRGDDLVEVVSGAVAGERVVLRGSAPRAASSTRTEP